MRKKLLIALAVVMAPLAVTMTVGATGSHGNPCWDNKPVKAEKEDVELKKVSYEKPKCDQHDCNENKYFGRKHDDCDKPKDVCKNIPGYQKEVPEGKVLNEQHKCVDKPVEVPVPTPVPTPTPEPTPQPVPTPAPVETPVTTPEVVVTSSATVTYPDFQGK